MKNKTFLTVINGIIANLGGFIYITNLTGIHVCAEYYSINSQKSVGLNTCPPTNSHWKNWWALEVNEW